MAAAVGGAVLGRVFAQSEAEKAFEPWWDTAENYCVYGLLMLGKLFSI